MASRYEVRVTLLLRLFLFGVAATAIVFDFELDGHAVADDDSVDAAWRNGNILNASLQALRPHDKFIVPNKTFHVIGGITASGLTDVVIQLDGTLSFLADMSSWPRDATGRVLECLHLLNMQNVTVTSSGKGTLDGNGAVWWGFPGIGYLLRQENRPRLMVIDNSSEILVENVLLKNSPYWSFLSRGGQGLEIRHCDVDVRRSEQPRHTLYDLTAFNTDGFDVSGKDIWIHDCTVWNQDDSFCVKDDAENVLIERVEASGIGLVIGSIASNVRNITFRNATMRRPVNGIYMKFRDAGSIRDVLYENIVIEAPERWGIWIGPAQQVEKGKDANGTSHFVNPCSAGGGCSLCWPMFPFTSCKPTKDGLFQNITLRNITINNPKNSPGVIMAPAKTPMQDLVFDNVVVNNPGFNRRRQWGSNYLCENVASGKALGSTSPVPPCFGESLPAVIEEKEEEGGEREEEEGPGVFV